MPPYVCRGWLSEAIECDIHERLAKYASSSIGDELPPDADRFSMLPWDLNSVGGTVALFCRGWLCRAIGSDVHKRLAKYASSSIGDELPPDVDRFSMHPWDFNPIEGTVALLCRGWLFVRGYRIGCS